MNLGGISRSHSVRARPKAVTTARAVKISVGQGLSAIAPKPWNAKKAATVAAPKAITRPAKRYTGSAARARRVLTRLCCESMPRVIG